MDAMELLRDKNILIINKLLAQAVGLNASIALRQLVYWMDINEQANKTSNYKDGKWWAFNTYEKWQTSNFTFWSMDTIARTFLELESLGLVESTATYNAAYPMDKTKWYTVNHALYTKFMDLWVKHGSPLKNSRKEEGARYQSFMTEWKKIISQQSMSATPQVAGTLPQVAPSNGQVAGTENRNLRLAIPETNTEDTKETTKENYYIASFPDAARWFAYRFVSHVLSLMNFDFQETPAFEETKPEPKVSRLSLLEPIEAEIIRVFEYQPSDFEGKAIAPLRKVSGTLLDSGLGAADVQAMVDMLKESGWKKITMYSLQSAIPDYRKLQRKTVPVTTVQGEPLTPGTWYMLDGMLVKYQRMNEVYAIVQPVKGAPLGCYPAQLKTKPADVAVPDEPKIQTTSNLTPEQQKARLAQLLGGNRRVDTPEFMQRIGAR